MEDRAKRKVNLGVVKKKSGLKTLKVEVTTLKRHPLYKKVLKISKNYLVDAEENAAEVGDKVLIMECRPISANKRWRLHKKVETKATGQKKEVKA
ncbi:30S ribosomal protein S17 [bacterium]|nr:30S ribosomal protein S17 [bacterium]MBT3581166.1 30S ribosomal protein S17 [bacterium]MBT4551599.1 30S ribosomal protein S17 [bacterium]MBT5988894.1 30S ribosomal protein S17 [bacterium]